MGLTVGDLVQPESPFVLEGCDRALVISTEPLILVSEQADKIWKGNVAGKKFNVVGKAGEETIEKCNKLKSQADLDRLV